MAELGSRSRKARWRIHDRHDLRRECGSLAIADSQREVASKRFSCPSKYVSSFLRAYPDLYYETRRHVCLLLNLDLDLDLNLCLYLDLHLNLNLLLFPPSFLSFFAPSFDSVFVSKYPQL